MTGYHKSIYLFITISTVIVVLLILLNPIIIRLLPPSTSDDSIVTQSPCAPPCWYNLTPGVSTRDDVSKVLHNTTFIPDWAIEEEQGQISWFWSLGHMGKFQIDDDGILISMEIIPNFQFPVERILDLYGEPDALTSRLDTPVEDGSFNLNLYFYYPDRGLVINFRSPFDPEVDTALSPDLYGYGFELHEPADTLEAFISRVKQVRGTELDNYMATEVTLGWPGFGSLVATRLNRSIYLDPLVFVTVTPHSSP